MSSALRMNPATTADVEDICTLAETSYRGDSARQGWTHESDILDGTRTKPSTVKKYIESEGQVILLLRDESGTLQACCHVALANPYGHDLQAKTAYFGLFAVLPSLQGAGLGRKIMQFAEGYARDVFGAVTIEMTVITARLELIDWYKRQGYAQVGGLHRFPGYDDPQFGVPKIDNMEFLTLSKPLQPAAVAPAT